MRIVRLEGSRVLKALEVQSGKPPRIRVMSMSDLRLGHPGSDPDFPAKVIQHIKSLPPNEKPHVVLATRLTYGERRKSTMTLNQQNNQAGRFVQELEQMGITVVDRI